jgi:hypothetical protein
MAQEGLSVFLRRRRNEWDQHSLMTVLEYSIQLALMPFPSFQSRPLYRG